MTSEKMLSLLGSLGPEFRIDIERTQSGGEPIEESPIVNIWIDDNDPNITRGWCSMTTLVDETDSGYEPNGEFMVRGQTVTPNVDVENPPEGFELDDSGHAIAKYDDIEEAIEGLVEISRNIRKQQVE